MVAAARTAAEAASVAMVDFMATLGLLAENVAMKAAAIVVGRPQAITEWAVARTAGLELGAIQTRWEIVRRIIIPQSTMASGIRSGIPGVPHGLVPAKDAIPEAWRTRASPLVTPESQMAPGTPLARLEVRPESSAEPPELLLASVDLATVGEVAMVGAAVAAGVVDGAGAGAGAGEFGASASVGPTGGSAGLGGTTLIGTARGRRRTTTIRIMATRITATTGPTIRRHTGRTRHRTRRIALTRRRAT